jgi:DNA replication initiation complex subunit (GINS family)
VTHVRSKSQRTLLSITHGKYSRLLDKIKSLEKANAHMRSAQDIEEISRLSHVIHTIYMMLDDACTIMGCPENVPCRDCPITVLKGHIRS